MTRRPTGDDVDLPPERAPVAERALVGIGTGADSEAVACTLDGDPG